jgi:hypothetical protein
VRNVIWGRLSGRTRPLSTIPTVRLAGPGGAHECAGRAAWPCVGFTRQSGQRTMRSARLARNKRVELTATARGAARPEASARQATAVRMRCPRHAGRLWRRSCSGTTDPTACRTPHTCRAQRSIGICACGYHAPQETQELQKHHGDDHQKVRELTRGYHHYGETKHAHGRARSTRVAAAPARRRTWYRAAMRRR